MHRLTKEPHFKVCIIAVLAEKAMFSIMASSKDVFPNKCDTDE